MSEEKKAIETLKEVASDDFDTLGDDISPKMAQNILNVIDNQQKEIVRYKKEIKKLQNKDCISKDKIIEWLDRFDIEEDLQNEYDELLGSEAIFEFLKKLLEEN